MSVQIFGFFRIVGQVWYRYSAARLSALSAALLFFGEPGKDELRRPYMSAEGPKPGPWRQSY